MPPSILVAYVTRRGSTGAVAETVGAALRESGLSVKVASVEDPLLMGDYSAVILGAPLTLGRFPGEMHHFLSQNRHVLSALRPWFFAFGPGTRPFDREVLRRHAERQLARHSWLRPAELQIFGRRPVVSSRRSPLSFLGHLVAFRKRAGYAMDLSEKEAIRIWAAGIGRQLRSAA